MPAWAPALLRAAAAAAAFKTCNAAAGAPACTSMHWIKCLWTTSHNSRSSKRINMLFRAACSRRPRPPPATACLSRRSTLCSRATTTAGEARNFRDGWMPDCLLQQQRRRCGGRRVSLEVGGVTRASAAVTPRLPRSKSSMPRHCIAARSSLPANFPECSCSQVQQHHRIVFHARKRVEELDPLWAKT